MCWLCEGNESKVLAFIGESSIKLGKDKNNNVAFMQKYRRHESFIMYKPNFCPECGKDLRETNEANPKRYNYGVCNGYFYEIYNHGNYFSGWIIDVIPTDVTENGIAQFEDDHVNEGDSVCGTLKEVVDYIYDLLVAKDE